MKNSLLYTCLLFAVVFFVACKKDPADPPPANIYKIELIDGDGQSDTTGNTLKTELVYKVTLDDDTIASPASVLFETYDCDNQKQVEEYGAGNGQLINVAYHWRLNGIQGTQYLKAILLDSLGNRKDSVTTSAIAVAAAHGWYSSGCMPLTTFCVTFCKLTSGRILTGLYREDYPYYSDDEGATWHPLATLPGKYHITKMISTPQNEVYLTIANTGMFYSDNGGQSWQLRNTGLPPLSGFWGNLEYTKSGKLFTLTQNGIYMSVNKGVSWQQEMNGLNYYAGFSDACSMSDGTILVIHDNHLYRSTTGGLNWSEVYTLSSTVGLSFLFVDDNDDIYIGISTGLGMSYGMYVSKDKAQTWTKIYTSSPAPGYDLALSEMTKQNGTYYFYSSSEKLLMKTTDFNTFTPANPPVGSNNGRKSFRYIVTDNNHLILSTEWYGLYYYIP
jgi:BNR/Asp-box repeat